MQIFHCLMQRHLYLLLKYRLFVARLFKQCAHSPECNTEQAIEVLAAPTCYKALFLHDVADILRLRTFSVISNNDTIRVK